MTTAKKSDRPGGANQQPAGELAAYKEVARVMLGFEQADEMTELFGHEIVRTAMRGLEDALVETRAKGQPDEFALPLAIERELLSRARAAGHDLEQLFNDPDHHTPPSEEVSELVADIWNGKRPG